MAYKVTTFVCYLIIPTDNLEYLNKWRPFWYLPKCFVWILPLAHFDTMGKTYVKLNAHDWGIWAKPEKHIFSVQSCVQNLHFPFLHGEIVIADSKHVLI